MANEGPVKGFKALKMVDSNSPNPMVPTRAANGNLVVDGTEYDPITLRAVDGSNRRIEGTGWGSVQPERPGEIYTVKQDHTPGFKPLAAPKGA